MNHDDIFAIIRSNVKSHKGIGDSFSFDLNDDIEVRVTIEHDPDYSINDYDSDGKVSKYCYDYIRDGREPRPSGFTGRARKIQVDRGYWMWWEPYEELTEAQIVEEMPRIRDLLETGFADIHVEFVEVTTDRYDNEHDVVVAEKWMGGTDLCYTSDADGRYLCEVLADMVDELVRELAQKTLDMTTETE